MAVTLVRAVTLNVGQGMCNMIEIYDGGAPARLIMCDCGSTAAPLNWNGGNGYFDWAYTAFPALSGLFISHGDADHVNGLYIRLSGFNLAGCHAWLSSYSGVAAAQVHALVGANGATGQPTHIPLANIVSHPAFYSCYSTNPPTPVCHYNNEVYFYVVGAGMSAGNDANDNCLSLAVSFHNKWLYFPGDSTGDTYTTLEAHLPGWGCAPPLLTPFMVSAPHHGSSTTIVRSGYSAQSFRALFPAAWVEASAYDQYNHPAAAVLLDIIGNTALGANHHFHVYSAQNTAYMDKFDNYLILTNFVEDNTNPERAACYCFEINSLGQTKVGFYDAYDGTWQQNPPVAPAWNYNTGVLLEHGPEAPRPVPTARRGARARGAERIRTREDSYGCDAGAGGDPERGPGHVQHDRNL